MALVRSICGVSMCSERESKEFGEMRRRSSMTARHTNREEDIMS
jgi:hypothetical protein